jgi:hypothetical protein
MSRHAPAHLRLPRLSRIKLSGIKLSGIKLSGIKLSGLNELHQGVGWRHG